MPATLLCLTWCLVAHCGPNHGIVNVAMVQPLCRLRSFNDQIPLKQPLKIKTTCKNTGKADCVKHQANHLQQSQTIGVSKSFLDLSSVWWLTYPSEKYEFVSWDDDIPNIWKVKNSCSKPPTSHDLSHKNGNFHADHWMAWVPSRKAP